LQLPNVATILRLNARRFQSACLFAYRFVDKTVPTVLRLVAPTAADTVGFL
jgi:hypothetical protein